MNQSIWLMHSHRKYPALSANKKTKIAIIGGGLTGCACAYFLSHRYQDITILEADQIGYGASGRNTGKLCTQQGLIYQKLIKKHGIEKAKLYYQSQKEAIDSIEKIIQTYGIDCNFQRCKSFLYTQTQSKVISLQQEYQCGLDLNIPMQYIDATNKPFKIQAGIQMDHQAQYHPYQFLCGLCDILDERNVAIYEQTPLQSITYQNSCYQLQTQHATIEAEIVILCTQVPFHELQKFYTMRCYPEVSHLIAAATAKPKPYHLLYQVEQPLSSTNRYMDNLLIHCGYSHPCGECNKDSYQLWIQQCQSKLNLSSILCNWQTQDIMSYDNLPMIGKVSKKYKNLYAACGYSKWGNTNAIVAAKVITAQITNIPTKYDALFDINRFSTFCNKKCLFQNVKAMMNYLKAPTITSNGCNIGQGKLIHYHEKRYGLYRINKDEAYLIDPICPHKHCICNFNEITKTWDCPCHGSIFDVDGTIIKGPSSYALPCKKIKLKHTTKK